MFHAAIESPPSVVVTVVARCPADGDDLSTKAIQDARQRFPGPLTRQTREGLRAYIVGNAARLFDPEKTGYFTFQRYADVLWATTRVVLPEPTCTLDFNQYLLIKYGPEDNLAQLRENDPVTIKYQKTVFDGIAGSKGFIDRKDLEREWFPSFRARDKHHNDQIQTTVFGSGGD